MLRGPRHGDFGNGSSKAVPRSTRISLRSYGGSRGGVPPLIIFIRWLFCKRPLLRISLRVLKGCPLGWQCWGTAGEARLLHGVSKPPRLRHSGLLWATQGSNRTFSGGPSSLSLCLKPDRKNLSPSWQPPPRRLRRLQTQFRGPETGPLVPPSREHSGGSVTQRCPSASQLPLLT